MRITRSRSTITAKIISIVVTYLLLALVAGVANAQSVAPEKMNADIINKMSRNFTECPIMAGSRATAEVKMALAGNRINSEEWLAAKMRTDSIAAACRAEAEIRYELAPPAVTTIGGKPEMTMPVIERIPAAKLKLIS